MMNNDKPVQFSPSNQAAAGSRSQSGHTLAEVMVSIAVIGFMLVSLYAGFSSGFAVVRLSRENLRATQILAERMEVLRLVKWDDLNTPGFIPTNFAAPFYASGQTNLSQGNFVYQGTVTIAKAPVDDTSYATNLHMIQIDLMWTSGNITRKRQMTTFVSRDGLQNYVY